MKISRYIFLLLVLVFTFPAFAKAVDFSKRQSLTAHEAATLQQNVIYLDVRSPAEWRAGHIKGSTHIPHYKVRRMVTSMIPDRSVPIVVYCVTGERAVSVINALHKRGYTAVPVTNGGYLQLVAHGMKYE